MEQGELNVLWETKITNKAITDMVYKIARGDKDLYQEGLLGIRAGLIKDPDASDDQLIRRARWEMSHYKHRGTSLDTGTNGTYSKTLKDGTKKFYTRESIPTYLDEVMEEFKLEFPDFSYPPDILAIDKIAAEKFYKSLNNPERHFVKICIKVLTSGHFYKADAQRILRMSRVPFERRKQAVYRKFIRCFGTDEELNALA